MWESGKLMPDVQKKAVLVLGLETPDLGPVRMQGRALGWYFKMKKNIVHGLLEVFQESPGSFSTL